MYFPCMYVEKFDTFKDIFLIPKDGEQPIEFFEVYNQYLTRFEERIEQFIRKVCNFNLYHLTLSQL